MTAKMFPRFRLALPVSPPPTWRKSAAAQRFGIRPGLVREFNGLGNGVLDGRGRGAGEFDEFVNVVFQVRFFRYRRRTIKNSAI